MTTPRDLAHDWFRMSMAARDLSNPDTSARARRSAQVSFYRAFRSLSEHLNDQDMWRATVHLGAYTLRQGATSDDG